MKVLYTIPNPCPRRWEDMQGGDVKRHCASCNTMVHAINEYSTAEWECLWRESGGKVCGMLPQVSAPLPRSRRAILLGALLTAASPLMAQNGRVRIIVTDRSNAAVSGADVSLLGKDGKPIQTLKTNTKGEVVWTGLPLGDNRFLIDARGFSRPTIIVTVMGEAEILREVVLEVGGVGNVITVRPTA